MAIVRSLASHQECLRNHNELTHDRGRCESGVKCKCSRLECWPRTASRMAKERMAGLTFDAASAATNGLARTARLLPDPESFEQSLMQ